MSQIFSPSGAKVLSSCIQKNSLLVGSKGSVFSIALFRNLQVIRDGFCLRNVDGSSSAWEYIYSYSISNKIYQQFTQHTVGHTPHNIEGKQYTYYHNENGG